MDERATAEAREIEESFRDANRRILQVAEDLSVDAPVPFLCECCDTGCHEVLRMSWGEFEALHRDNSLFVVVPGHERRDVERLVTESDTYNVVQK